MTRYYALVLVPGDRVDDETINAAAELLYPYMHSESEPERDYTFGWFLQPDDLAEDEEELAQYAFRAIDIINEFPGLEIEAILTPDGQWHRTESGIPDDEEWVREAQAILKRYPDALALKHLLHI